MNTLKNIPVLARNIQYLGLLILLITAYFSEGFYRGDEYLLLEYASYFLGDLAPDKLCWEFDSQIRPSLQSIIGAGFIKFVYVLGSESPFVATLVLRLVTAVFSFFVLRYSCLVQAKKGDGNVLSIVTFLSWFIVYISVRFSSETWSGLCFFTAFLLWFNKDVRSVKRLLVIGVMAGLAFQFRYQTAVMSIGFLLWLVIVDKQNVKVVFNLLIGFLIVLIAGTLLDFWFYGEWVVAPYNYFYVNIVEDVVSTFGVDAWYHFVPDLLNKTYFIFGILILISIVLHTYKKPLSAVTFVVVPFIIFHSSIGHKEMRFLFPLVYFVPFYLTFLLSKVSSIKVNKLVFKGFILINLIFLIGVMFFTFNPTVKTMRYVYNHLNENDRLYCIGDNPYDRSFQILFFDSSHRPNILEIDDFESYEENATGEDYIYVYGRSRDLKYKLPGSSELVFQDVPLFITDYFDVNNWTSRTTIAKFYKIN